LNFWCEFNRALRRDIALVGERAIKGDAGFQIGIVRRKMPDVATAAAEAHDAEPVRIAALRFGPGHGGVQICEQFGVALTVDFRHQLLGFGDFGHVAEAEVIIGRDREGAEMPEPPRHVLDEFVDAENFHADKNDRRVLHARRPRKIDRHVAARDFNLGVAGFEPLGIGVDDVGAYRPGGERIARGGGR